MKYRIVAITPLGRFEGRVTDTADLPVEEIAELLKNVSGGKKYDSFCFYMTETDFVVFGKTVLTSSVFFVKPVQEEQDPVP